MRYAKHVSTKVTPQSQPIPGTAQVQNSAGGYTYQVDEWTRLTRFLILGSEGGTYYASEQKLTLQNAKGVMKCLDKDGKRAVDEIVKVSVEGRAVKQDPALFAFALACRHKDLETRQYARTMLSKVARIGTHLFHFADSMNELGGWGQGVKRLISRWYTQADAGELAYQLVKYPSRDGWSHRDLLRKTHPKVDDVRSEMFKWATSKEAYDWKDTVPAKDDPMARLWARDTAMKLKVSNKAELKTLLNLITDYRLPRECIPTEALNEPEVWEALLVDMPVHALVRNLGKLTSVGVLKPLSAAEKKALSLLGDFDRLKKARLHPLNVLVALNTYRQGHGAKGSLKWKPVQRIVDALDEAFYATFKTIEPANKRMLLGIDVSGSMGSPELSGMTGISPRVAAAVMAMVSARSEPQYYFFAFTHKFMHLPISANMRLDQVIEIVDRNDFGRTDCAVPMLCAMEMKFEVDVFAVYTDNETWAGSIHPSQALRQYRQKMGIAAKQVVVGMTATDFTIADPDDAGTMDVAGFDSSAPAVIADFARG